MAGAPAGGGGGGQSDNSAAMLWSVAAIFAAIAGIWFGLKKYIVSFYLTLKLYEVEALSIVGGHYFDQSKAVILSALTHPEQITFTNLIAIGQMSGNFLRIPLVILFFILAFVIYTGNSVRSFKRTYGMKELAELEKQNWPQITPVVSLDLVNTDINKGPWAMAMTPMQFCKRYRLLIERKPERREGLAKKEWNRIEVTLDRGAANRIFALQLGTLWKSPQALPPHIKALFAVFAARVNADKTAADILHQLNVSSATKLDFTGVNELCAKHENSKLVQKIILSHAYVLTVMASMLEGAREDGVQASADFLWLKPLDRRLWYMLNTVGRQTPFAEVAGPFAHWTAEKAADAKIYVPMIEEATKALELALTETIYKADEPTDAEG